jgi:5'-deoxynucleotidase YfbR-like HD superfamily hydrolase
MTEDRLTQQIAFLVEADRLKSVIRRTPLVDGSRRENSAEHSWHLALAAMILREYVAEPVDLLRLIELVTIHDLVEIDAGDAFAYDDAAQSAKAARELAAADRLFGLLPADQTSYVRGLWEEFETQETIEARVANALDRFQPLLQNAHSGGGSWRTHDLTRADVLRRMAPVEHALPTLWPVVVQVIDSFCDLGVLRAVNREP